jgi:hypothetical protein
MDLVLLLLLLRWWTRGPTEKGLQIISQGSSMSPPLCHPYLAAVEAGNESFNCCRTGQGPTDLAFTPLFAYPITLKTWTERRNRGLSGLTRPRRTRMMQSPTVSPRSICPQSLASLWPCLHQDLPSCQPHSQPLPRPRFYPLLGAWRRCRTRLPHLLPKTCWGGHHCSPFTSKDKQPSGASWFFMVRALSRHLYSSFPGASTYPPASIRLPDTLSPPPLQAATSAKVQGLPGSAPIQKERLWAVCLLTIPPQLVPAWRLPPSCSSTFWWPQLKVRATTPCCPHWQAHS